VNVLSGPLNRAMRMPTGSAKNTVATPVSAPTPNDAPMVDHTSDQFTSAPFRIQEMALMTGTPIPRPILPIAMNSPVMVRFRGDRRTVLRTEPEPTRCAVRPRARRSTIMSNNATATTIAATGTFYKVAGTTTGSSANQKFNTATSNRATYTGAFSATFRVVVTAAVTSGNNQTLRCRIGKNGTTIPDSETEFKTSSAGESSNFTVQTLAELATNDYLEVFVANDTSATNATFKHLNVIITRIN